MVFECLDERQADRARGVGVCMADVIRWLVNDGRPLNLGDWAQVIVAMDLAHRLPELFHDDIYPWVRGA